MLVNKCNNLVRPEIGIKFYYNNPKKCTLIININWIHDNIFSSKRKNIAHIKKLGTKGLRQQM